MIKHTVYNADDNQFLKFCLLLQNMKNSPALFLRITQRIRARANEAATITITATSPGRDTINRDTFSRTILLFNQKQKNNNHEVN